MNNVQRVFGYANDVLTRFCQTSVDLEHFFERRCVLIVVLVQDSVFILSFDQLALFAHTGVIVVQHNGAILLNGESGSVFEGGFVGGDSGLFFHGSTNKMKTKIKCCTSIAKR